MKYKLQAAVSAQSVALGGPATSTVKVTKLNGA